MGYRFLLQLLLLGYLAFQMLVGSFGFDQGRHGGFLVEDIGSMGSGDSFLWVVIRLAVVVRLRRFFNPKVEAQALFTVLGLR